MSKATITDVRRTVLRNIHEGRNPYAGFSGSQLGGAYRSVQMWSWGDIRRYIDADPDDEHLVLTREAIRVLKE